MTDDTRLEEPLSEPADDSGFEPMGLSPKRPLEEEIIARASANHEPLPMLDVICARIAAGLSPMLKSQNGFLSETEAEAPHYDAWGRALGTLHRDSCAVIGQSSWGGPVLFALDPRLLHAVLSVMLGGAAGRDAPPQRAPTAIEKAFASRLLAQVAREAEHHFSRITEVTFRLEPIESPVQIASLLAAGAQVAVFEMRVTLGGVTGLMSMILPLDTLEPARAHLGKMFLGERLGGDASWRDHFAGQIGTATLQVEAELHRLPLPLAEVLAWKPGVTIDLGITLGAEATLRCSDRAILHGVTGRRKNGRVAVKITREAGEPLPPGDDDDLLGD
ncbi:flagellar motor switch protein FliM [Falsigemmobacter intermedius]|uniref:flagellar motor switch protein FliM n=1 Tax=Falsigemmobacter intermedius TaxID=1553448 RepID=UPI003F01A0AB